MDASKPERKMSLRILGCTPPVWRTGLVGTAILAAVIGLTSARSEKFQSLADYIAAICASPLRSSASEEAPYLSETISAMTKMMIDMGIRPTGNVDHDFVEMMVPHHQGAIDAAIAVLRYGRNTQIKRLAQEIIVTQQQEIAAMRLAVGEPLPPSMPSPARIQSLLLTNPPDQSETPSTTER
jgi:hypothetical protein